MSITNTEKNITIGSIHLHFLKGVIVSLSPSPPITLLPFSAYCTVTHSRYHPSIQHHT